MEQTKNNVVSIDTVKLTPAQKQSKIVEYLQSKGKDTSSIPKVIEDSVLASLIDDTKKDLKRVEYLLKKRYPADFKDYTKRIDGVMNDLLDHKLSNEANYEQLAAITKEIREHPVAKEVTVAESEKNATLEIFAKEHTICMFGGKVCIRREEKHDWILPDQLAKFHSNIDVMGADGKPQNIVYAFMEWDKAPRFGEVVFNPSKPGNHDDCYNIFQGWTVEPEPGEEDAPWWDVLQAACGYNPDYVEYTMKWFADIFQNPSRKPGTAIGISGRQGVGKSALVETIGMLLANINGVGDTRIITGAYGDFSMDELLADYNEHVANKLLVYLDEATWGGSHVEQQRMKKIITKQYENINPKFLGRIQLYCYRREVFSSNNEFYYRPDKDDRRLLPLEYDTSEINEKSFDFWQKFYAARSKGKMLQNLLYNLQHVDLTGWEPQEALKKLRITTGSSMLENAREPWENWLREIAEDGFIIREVDGEHSKIEIQETIANRDWIADAWFENAFLLWAKKHRINGNAANWYGDKFKKERTKMLGQQERKTFDYVSQKGRKVPSSQEMLKRLNEGTRWVIEPEVVKEASTSKPGDLMTM